MTKKLVLIPMLLSLVCLAVVADSAHAQRGRRGDRGRRSNLSYDRVYSDVYYPGYSNYSDYSNLNSGVVPNYSYYPASPDVIQQSPYVQQAQFVLPGQGQQNLQQVQGFQNIANIRVLLPDPQARVMVDGNLTRQLGTDRLYHSPSLAPGSSYSYQIRATWMQNGREMTREQNVNVMPGQTMTVDFTRLNAGGSGNN